MRVYAENVAGRPATYQITPEVWNQAVDLRDGVQPRFFTHDSPDLAALEEADVFVGSKLNTARLRAHGKNLRLVHCTSAGVEHLLPLDWLPSGAVLTNSSGIHQEKAREYVQMALLMLANRMPKYVDDRLARRWDPQLTGLAKGMRVLVVGTGSIGKAAISAAVSLGMRVETISRTGALHQGVECAGSQDDLLDFLQRAQVVILCCPLTPATRRLIGRVAFQAMPKGAMLINICRGQVLDTQELIIALESGHIGGAVLDVFDEEPLPWSSGLWAASNLMMTPHVSCDSPVGYVAKSLEILARNLRLLLSGQPVAENVVDPGLGY